MADGELINPEDFGLHEEPTKPPSRWMRTGSSRPEMTDAEKIAAISTLEPREKRWGYIVTGIQGAVGTLLSVIVLTHRPYTTSYSKVGKNGTCPLPFFPNPDHHATAAQKCVYQAQWSNTSVGVFIGSMVLLTAFLFLTTRRGRRSLAIVAGVLSALAMFSTSILFVAPPAAYAAVLFIRSYKLQQETGGRAASLARNKSARDERIAARKQGRSATNKTSNKGSTAPSGPTANKRYTPKAPPKKSRPTS
jgi:hypothetical protein